ncbi:MAG TPA: hypothetical protein VN581_11200 [Patescibacteria group bacterium]|nr:hypothetical protein [Patescibacteria group bacterium]
MARIGCLVMVLLLMACSRAPDEQRLRDTIAAMAASIESGESGDFVDHVADDFSGQGGGIDQRQLRAMLVAQTLRHPNISVLLGPLDVKRFGERATVKLRVIVTGGQWLPETGRQIELESHWRIEDGDWICFRADWQ